MTVAITTSREAYVGNGVTTDFPTTFRFLEDGHLVVKVTPAGGVETVKTLGVDYIVDGAGDDGGGTVTFFAPPANGAAVVIERVTPVTQETALRNQGSFSPAVHERELDKGRMIDQELERRVSDVENASTTNNAVAGNGLTVSVGATWHVGAGNGIQANADDIEVVFGTAADLANVNAAAGDAGVLNKAARADHKHDVDTDVPGAIAIGAAAAEGAANALARADHVHAMPDPAGPPPPVSAGPAAEGVSGAAARADHTHTVATDIPVTIGAINDPGGADTLSRSDHLHAHGNQPGGALHAVVVPSGAAGFITGGDKTKLDGYGASYTGAVQTADNVPQTVASKDVTDNSLEQHEAMVVGFRSTRSEGVGYKLVGTFRRDGAVVTQIGATTVEATHEDAAAAAWNATFDVVGTTVRVRVTGEAAKTVNWRARVRVCEVASG